METRSLLVEHLSTDTHMERMTSLMQHRHLTNHYDDGVLRWNELKGDGIESSVYERTIASPNTDDELQLMFIISAASLFVVSSFILTLFLSIVSSKKARSTPFNQYLLFLSFPDWIYSFLCFLTCFMSALVGHYYSPFMCRFQSVYMMFGTGANTWVNAVITYE